MAACTASLPRARGSTPGDGQSSFMASGQTVRRTRPRENITAAVCPDGPSGRGSSGAGGGWKVEA
eukprot:2814561-Alexandrium_andersonii.AAC.1